MASIQNLASGILASSVNPTDGIITISCGIGTEAELLDVWPKPPFFITVMPSAPAAGVANSLDSEIMKVKGRTVVGKNMLLFVDRAQKGTTAKSFSQSDIVTNGVYVDDILDKFYPIGTIYLTVSLDTADKVTEALGGTWVAWGSGRVPVGVNSDRYEFETVERTGGEMYHALTVQELPSHSHPISSGWSDIDPGRDAYRYQRWGGRDLDWKWGDLGTGNTGGDRAHNNLQPYITCYMYKRIG